ncbi:MAG: nucleoside triphosphate pyrophosphohydrolase [Dehalococcoidales bacterium]|nr:nucleoside triphosphate pyrophosphohydrolase [Dehalococcoidales bacterium]
MNERYQTEFTRLVEIVARLRGPDGCPWDKKQTHASLKEFLLEESYEVLEALDENDHKKLCQELGDLLLQIMLHSRIAGEKGEFDLADVISHINDKLIRRHPHVFAGETARTAEEVSGKWESIKRNERKPEASMLSSVPRSMPALAYSQDIQRRVAQVGFDWENIEGVIEKLVEEVKELAASANQEEKTDEFGDIFFTLANIARRMEIDPEAALRQSNRKFYLRFSYMEKLCRERDLDLGKLSFHEQNALWEEAKKGVNGRSGRVTA